MAIRIPSHGTPGFVSDGVLSANSGRKYPKNAAKTKVLESFPRLECRPWKPFCHANRALRCNALLSHGPCGTIRWPLTRARAGPAR